MRKTLAQFKQNIGHNGLFSGSVVYLLSNILAAAIPFALLPILTRYLSTAEYGQVAIYQTVLAGLSALVGVSAHGAAGIKYYESDLSKYELKLFIGNCFLITLINSLFMFFIILFFNAELANWLTIPGEWLFIGVFVSSATCFILMRMTQWQVSKKARSFGIFQISQSLMGTGLALLFVVYFLEGAAGRMWSLTITPIVFLLISLVLFYKDDLLGFGWRLKYIKEILKFGVPLIPHSVGFFLLSAVDRFIINDKLGLAQVGIYMVAVQLVAVMGLVFDAINNAYVPWLFERLKRDRSDEKRQIVRWTYAYGLALMCFTGFIFVFAPALVLIVVGEEYAGSADLIGWLALGQAFNGMYLMVTNYIFYSKRTGLLSLSTITTGLINVGLLFLFTDHMGLKGAAIAYAASMGLKFVTTWFVANLRHPMPWFNFNRSSDQC